MLYVASLFIPASVGDCEVEGNCSCVGAVAFQCKARLGGCEASFFYQARLRDCEVEGNCCCMGVFFSNTRLGWRIVKSGVIAAVEGGFILNATCSWTTVNFLRDCEVEGTCCCLFWYQFGLGNCEVEGNCCCVGALCCLIHLMLALGPRAPVPNGPFNTSRSLGIYVLIHC